MALVVDRARGVVEAAGAASPVAALEGAFAGVGANAPGEALVNYAAFDLEQAKREVREEGYYVCKNLIPTAHIEEIRAYWLGGPFADTAKPRVTWSPFLGQENTIGFSDDEFQCIWRSCDFLWNAPMHDLTRQICMRLNGLRNLILDLDPLLGVRYAPDRYGIFVTTTYYPPGRGFMDMHRDGVKAEVPLLHHIVPLTFKGRHYASGGMQVEDRRGNKVDVDALLEPGDAVFYDGALMHGVGRIGGKPGEAPVGRLQMFAIPTRFDNVESNEAWISRISTARFAHVKWRRALNAIYRGLGLKQFIR